MRRLPGDEKFAECPSERLDDVFMFQTDEASTNMEDGIQGINNKEDLK